MNETQPRSFSERWLAPSAGAAFVILAAVAFVLDNPGNLESQAEFWDHWRLNAVRIQWQVYVYALAGLPFIAFFALLAQRFSSAAPRSSYLGSMMVAAAATTFVLQLLWASTRLTVTRFMIDLRPGQQLEPGLGFLIDLGDSASTLTSLTAAILVAAVAAAVLRWDVLPKIFGIASLGLFVLLLINGFVQIRVEGDWRTLGDATFFLFLLWSLVAAALTALRPAAAEPQHEDDRTEGALAA